MSKVSTENRLLPFGVETALEQMGSDFRLARERRKESLRSWAARMDISVPTLQRLEKGDPSVGMGIYVTAFAMCGRLKAFTELVEPRHDPIFKQEINAIEQKRRKAKP